MAIVGGFLGGGVEMVPAGYIQLCLQWITPDRLNIEGAKFTISGIGGTTHTETVDAKADGRMEVIVPVGTYMVSVEHSGVYANDAPQKVIGESTQSYLVMFGSETKDSVLRIVGEAFNANIKVKSTFSDEVAYNGPCVDIDIPINPGTYDLEITQDGKSQIFENFVISGHTAFIVSDNLLCVDLGDLVTFSDKSISVEGHDAMGKSKLYFVANYGEILVHGESTKKWDGNTAITLTYSKQLTDSDISFSLSEVMYSDPYVLSEVVTNKSASLPFAGTYAVTLIGGGGGGGGGGYHNSLYSGAGGSGGYGGGTNGRVQTVTSEQLTYKYTIGDGGNGGSASGSYSSYGGTGSNGNTTSISNWISSLSAAGGSGGAGGSRPGDGVSSSPAGNSGGYGGDGTNGSLYIRNHSYTTGKGGSGGSYSTSISANAGSYGKSVSLPSEEKVFYNSGHGGRGGNSGRRVTENGVKTATGGLGGEGGYGLCITRNGISEYYGSGGQGGEGSKYYSGVRGTSGLKGKSGAIVWELKL